MKLTIFFFATFLTIAAQANERIVKCQAIDSLDNLSVFEMNIDSGAIKTTPTNKVAKVLYSEAKKCGLNLGKAVCKQTIQHNMDMPNQPHFALLFQVSCKSGGGTVLKHMNGTAEINRFGDGNGSFVCGTLSSNELQLSNCTVH
jgi:hypothetical protein